MGKANFLIILAGLPASGKTVFTKQFKKFLKKKCIGFKITIVDPDIIRTELSREKFDYTLESIVREKSLRTVKDALINGDIVISDDLNYYTSMRHDLKEIPEELNCLFFIIHINTPIEVCLEWNEKRGKPIPQELIQQISNKFDSFGKYKWDEPVRSINMSTVNNLQNSIAELFDFIFTQLKTRITSLENNSEKKMLNLKNNELLEKVTRDIVNEVLKDPKKLSLKSDLLIFRKRFVKNNLNRALTKSEIIQNFSQQVNKEFKIGI